VSDPKKPLNLRARLARLDALIPDPDRHCCLEGFVAWREIIRPHFGDLAESLTLNPGEPEPPLEPPSLPLCQRTGEPLCALALARVTLIWSRRRSLAVAFTGLDDDSEPGRYL
jgi:hypothetical protein